MTLQEDQSYDRFQSQLSQWLYKVISQNYYHRFKSLLSMSWLCPSGWTLWWSPENCGSSWHYFHMWQCPQSQRKPLLSDPCADRSVDTVSSELTLKSLVILLSLVFNQILLKEREQRELDIQFNKLGSINLLASQETTASHPRRLQHLCTKGINTPPFPLPVMNCREAQREARDHRGLTRRCKPMQSPWKFEKLIGVFEKAPGPSQTQAPGCNPRGTKKLALSCSCPALAWCTHFFSAWPHGPWTCNSTCWLQEGA